MSVELKYQQDGMDLVKADYNLGLNKSKVIAKKVLGARHCMLIVLSSIVALFITGCRNSKFAHDVTTDRVPWSHEKFHNNPDNFQFAIIADRTGGERRGVFPEAAKKLNLLRPEFVMSVGDLIEGYTKDKETVKKQWDEFDRYVKLFDMPFFYVSGNHDITNKMMDDLWDKRYGKSYYSFVYKDVLFLCLDTQQTDGYIFNRPGRFISKKQVAWAKDILKKHSNVRWTCIFMHQPLWVYNKSKETGFQELEKVLKGRKYTVFAGHLHSYAKYIRNGQKYFMFATTGGGNKLRSIEQGEFDHAVWVTMTDDGPIIANLLLNSIHDEDVRTESMKKRQQREAYLLKTIKLKPEEGESKFSVNFTNPFPHKLQFELTWEDEGWEISPKSVRGNAAGKKKVKQLFTLKGKNQDLDKVPVCNIKLHAKQGLKKSIKIPARTLIRQLFPPRFDATHTEKPPTIDGKLNDKTWQNLKKNSGFRAKPDGQNVSAKTEACIAYDKNNLYVAMKCHEPNPDKVKANTKQHDGPVWKDDSVEIFLDTNQDRQTYFQLIVNSLGVTYDGVIANRSFELNPVVATAREGQYWTAEIAIPWENLKVKQPTSGSKWGVAFVRTRTQTKEIQQLPYLYGENHQPQMFGCLTFSNNRK